MENPREKKEIIIHYDIMIGEKILITTSSLLFSPLVAVEQEIA
jgi:hypothetical protein